MANSTELNQFRWTKNIVGLHPGVQTGSGGGSSAVSSSTVSKTKIKDWKRRIRLIQSATGPYSRADVNDHIVTGKIVVSYDWPNGGTPSKDRATVTLYGAVDCNPRPVTPNMPIEDLDIQARMGFLSKVRKARSSFQGGVFLGELKEAVHMIVRPGQALRKSISSYSTAAKKAVRRAKNSKAATKALTGTYLEKSFGWGPLAADIDNGMEALARTSLLIPEVVQYTAFKEYTTGVGDYTNVPPGTGIGILSRYRTRFSGLLRYKGAVAWESSNLAPSWRSNWGLETRDFVPTVWELIPWSFMVDYFTNLGKVIDAASLGTVSLRWGCKSTKQEAAHQLYSRKVYAPDPPNQQHYTVEAVIVPAQHLSRFSFSRQIIDSVSVGVSDLRFRCPGIDDTAKWLNIGALALEKLL
jgi:hypothetical protein